MRCNKVEVTYSRTVQPVQYESKAATATISYVPNDDEAVDDVSAALSEAFDLAQSHVHQRVGLISKGSAPANANVKAAVPEAEVQLTSAQKAAITRKANAAKKAASAATVAEDDGGGDAVPVAAVKAAAPPKASAASMVEDEGADVIEDGDLLKATSAKVAELHEAGVAGASDILRKNIASFNPKPGSPFKLPSIPQEQRQKYLDQIAMLAAPDAATTEDF